MSTFLPFNFQATLRRAFDAWATVANIEFIQVQDQGGNPDSAAFPTIRIFGGYIDGQSDSNTLAQAYFPSGSAIGGDMAFDSSNRDFFANENNFYLTALHEIGHALGLDHETSKLAIMNPSIDPSLRGLQADDIAGIRTVYGNQDFGPNHYFMAASQADMVILDSAPNLAVFGNDLDNRITGTAAAETIDGRYGNDTIIGGGGADTMRGGAGDDIYVVRSSDAIVEEFPNAGSDTIKTSVNYVLKAGVAVEQIRATGTAAIYIVGNTLKQTIIGNAGANILNDGGGAAVDTLRGLAGNDDYIVRNSDTVILELAGAGTDTIWATVDYLLKAGVAVERMRTTSDAGTTAINLTGNELQQVILGNAGANVLSDGAGAGADTLQGLGGNDTYRVGNRDAIIVEAMGGGNDTVMSSVDYVLKAGVEIELLRTNADAGTAAIDLTGNALAQGIVGNAGSNILSDGGGAGVDTLRGFGGDDTYRIGNSGAVIFEAANGGSDTVRASVDYVLKSGVEVEQLATSTSAGTAAIDLTGNEIAQRIIGNAGSNILDGKGGNDTLTGFGGKDFFVFSSTLGSGNVDRVADFDVADDTVRLENAIFTALTTTGALAASNFRANATGLAGDADDRIIYQTGTGKLFYDVDGSGAGGGILFATLTGAPAITAADFMVV